MGDLIKVYKLLHGYYNVDWPRLSSVHSTRGHHMKLFKKLTFIVKVKFFHSESDKCLELLYQMKLFYHPLPPLSLDSHWIDVGLGHEERVMEPELYFVIKAFVYIHAFKT